MGKCSMSDTPIVSTDVSSTSILFAEILIEYIGLSEFSLIELMGMEFLLASKLHICSEKSVRGTKKHCEVHLVLFVGTRPRGRVHRAGECRLSTF